MINLDYCGLDSANENNLEVFTYPNGTIQVSIDGDLTTINSEFCCNFLNTIENYSTTGYTFTWDTEFSQCTWIQRSDCDNLPTFNVTLNPEGNAGAIFEVDEGERCVLDVKFEYLFKFDCDTITSISGRTFNQQLEFYNNQIANANIAISEAQSALTENVGQFNHVLPYRIDPLDPNNIIYLCLTEAGVGLLEILMNNNPDYDFNDYLNGIYYSGNPADNLDDISTVFYNTANQPEPQGLYYDVCTDGDTLISETYSWITENNYQQNIIDTNEQIIITAQAEINQLLADNPNACITEIETLENLEIGMSIDIQNPQYEQLVNSIYSETFFNIGEGNLLTYLTDNFNSGLYIPNYNGIDCTDTACNDFANIIVDQLIAQANQQELLTGTTRGQNYQELIGIIGENYFNSNWLTYETRISDPAIISGITNQAINLSIQVLNSCIDFSILIDRIEINKVCERKVNDDIFVSENPRFNLKRVVDNKKSWTSIESPINREFNLPMRETGYDVNDYRLVINTKETDLNIAIDNAIETDVWCYVNDNPCILEPCTGDTNFIIITGDCSSFTITGVTNFTGGTTILPTINSGVDPVYASNLVRLQQAGSGLIPASAFTTEYSGCSFVHKIDRAFSITNRFTGAWIVGNSDGNVYWYSNQTISGGSETTRYYGDTLTGQTECEEVASAITAYNTFNGTNYQTIFWDGSGCKFNQVLTGSTTATTTSVCCCGETQLSGTSITGETIPLPPNESYSGCTWQVGDLGEAGGTVFWVDPNNPCRALEVAHDDLSYIGASGPEYDFVWSNGVQPPVFPSPTNTGIGYGLVNSTDILSGNNGTQPAAYQAAYSADTYSNGGYSDWFLPSAEELLEIYNNLPTELSISPTCANPETPPITYWSSSYINPNEIYVLDTCTGSLTSNTADGRLLMNNTRVRPIRLIDTSPCENVYNVITGSTSVTDGFEIEETECSWIYKFDTDSSPTTFDGYWLAGMPDGTLGVFQHITQSGVTSTTVNYTDIVTEDCCIAYNEGLRHVENELYLGRHLAKLRWDQDCQKCLINQCENEKCTDYNELLTTPITGLTTVTQFNDILNSELINVRCRKISSGYPTLNALYHRYLNSTAYCETLSSQFTYETMMEFSDLIGDYWVDLIEQVIPSTTIWTANYIYGNTLYDQEKFKYRSGSVFPCNPNRYYSGVLPMRHTASGPLSATNTDIEFVVGGRGPAGGIIYWLNPNNPYEGYEVMPFDQSNTVSWQTPIPPGSLGTVTDFGSGQANTIIMVNDIITPPENAATVCNNLSYNGFNDWFLPSRDDLQLVYNNTNTLTATTPSSVYWWSSSEYGGGNGIEAWVIDGNGAQVNRSRAQSTTPALTGLTRAVRYFNLDSRVGVQLYTLSDDGICKAYEECSDIYYYNGDCGSEFVGTVSVISTQNNNGNGLIAP